MTELDDDVHRRLIDAYRSKGPSAGERERVLGALTSAIATSAATPAVAASKGVFKFFALSRPLALSAVGFGVGCAVALGVWLARVPAPPAASQLCAAPCAPSRASPSTALSETPPVAVGSSEAPSPPSLPAAEVESSTAATPPPAVWKRPAAHGSDLAAEAALLQQAHGAYRRGQPAETLVMLREHAAKYPSTQLSVERGTLKVLALCALNRIDEARRIARALPPRSAALRGTCVER